ncbi:MAG TPA: OmpH family outer membrane protein [Bdellovibrionota bacterium]|nr:OmpH family outer membrane protein [Bdellovibrionota bacterium]
MLSWKNLIWILLLLAFAPVRMGHAVEMKVGVVNIQDVLDAVEEGKKAKAKMEGEIAKKKKDLDDRQAEYKKLDEGLEKQKLLLSPSALSEKQKELEAKKMEIQKLYMSSQTEMQKLEGQLMADILKKIRSVVAKIAQQNSYDLVVEKSEGGLLYYKDGYDITKLVVDEYNKAYKK